MVIQFFHIDEEFIKLILIVVPVVIMMYINIKHIYIALYIIAI